MSDSDDNESGSGSGSGSDNDESKSGSDNSNSGSDDESGSGSGSDSGSSKSSGSSSGSSDSGKKKKKKKGDDADNKPKMSLFFELQQVMRSILMDLNTVDKNVSQLEMRFNHSKRIKPTPRPPPVPKRPISQSPTRHYNPPGHIAHQ